MGRHAYLLMVHKVDYTVKTLLELIDDERNDIFVHMDKKNKAFKEEQMRCLVKKSNMFFLSKRLSIRWGTSSMMRCELMMFEAATNKAKYAYYHLISGADLPLKNQDHIHQYFADRQGYEFVGYGNDADKYQYRIQRYHLLTPWVGRMQTKTGFVGLLTKIERKIQNFQVNHNVVRYKGKHFSKGSQWVSITDALARSLVSHKHELESMYRFSANADESFIQTFVKDNPQFYNKVWQFQPRDKDDYPRLIDWSRPQLGGSQPHTWQMEDLDTLKNSARLFARKFDCNLDKAIIDEVKQMVLAPKQ